MFSLNIKLILMFQIMLKNFCIFYNKSKYFLKDFLLIKRCEFLKNNSYEEQNDSLFNISVIIIKKINIY